MLEVGGQSDSRLTGVRIARISTVPFFMVTQLKHQIETLAENGAEIAVITSPGPELEVFSALPGVVCTPIDIPRSISPCRDLYALMKLWKFFMSERIDIVHSTTPKAGLLAAIAAFMAGVPIRLHTFTGQPWVGMKGIKRWLAFTSDRLIGRLNTHCYADSESQRKFLINSGVLAAECISVIGAGSLAGVDVKRFDRERFPNHQRLAIRSSLNIPVDADLLLFVGRITSDKGIDELLQAFSRLKENGSQAHLLLVGPFDADSGVSGGTPLHRISNIKDIHLVGYTQCPEQYMAIADVLCLPSYREGFGTVVIEAAAMGVPAIGTNIYGLSDAIEDNKSGILVAVRDVDALYQGLARLLTDNTLRNEMGQAARQRAVDMFAADRVNAGVVEEYCRLQQGGKVP